MQSNGPFQPRLELLEEYRGRTGGTLHIIPLSRLLRLFEASEQIIEEVKQAEAQIEHYMPDRKLPSEIDGRGDEYATMLANIDLLSSRISEIEEHMRGLPPPTGNMSLPWDRAYYAASKQRETMIAQRQYLHERLAALALG